jgi:hypothetical protein
MSVSARLVSLAVAIAIMAPDAANAYVGPGAGLGMIGSLIAVVGAVLVAILGLFILPFRMLSKRRRAKARDVPEAAVSAGKTEKG